VDSASEDARPPNVAGALLAAGESTRMGRDKALLPIGQTTFLEHLVSILDGEVAPVIVVLGHHFEEISRAVRLPSGVKVLRNAEYQRGQLSSLQTALRALHVADGALVCLVDHPGVTKQVVRALVAAFAQSRAGVVIPTCRGRRGHPVLFSASLFGELLAAPLDQGARYVVQRHPDMVQTVEVDDEGILWDLDRPEDYEAFERRRAGK
jgi:molybdenum cofactor cytidylyltransferase